MKHTPVAACLHLSGVCESACVDFAHRRAQGECGRRSSTRYAEPWSSGAAVGEMTQISTARMVDVHA